MTGDTQNCLGYNVEEHLLTITGDLTFGARPRCTPSPVWAWAATCAPRLRLDGMTEVEGAIVTQHGLLQLYESDMDVQELRAEFAMLYLGRVEDTSGSKCVVHLSRGPYIWEPELEVIRAKLTQEVFDQMETYVEAQTEDEPRMSRFRWLSDQLPESMEDPEVEVWQA